MHLSCRRPSACMLTSSRHDLGSRVQSYCTSSRLTIKTTRSPFPPPARRQSSTNGSSSKPQAKGASHFGSILSLLPHPIFGYCFRRGLTALHVQSVLRPGVLVHQIPPREGPLRDRALPEGDPPRARCARERAVEAAVARRRPPERSRHQLHYVRQPFLSSVMRFTVRLGDTGGTILRRVTSSKTSTASTSQRTSHLCTGTSAHILGVISQLSLSSDTGGTTRCWLDPA